MNKEVNFENIEFVYQEISHAKRLFEILSNPNFLYFSGRPKSLEEEINYMKDSELKRKENSAHNFTIFLD